MISAIRRTLPALLAGLLVLGSLDAALAQSVRVLGDFRDWSSYATSGSADQICFMHSSPTQTDPQIELSSEPYFYVTHRPSIGVRHEMNLVSGYAFAPDSLASVSISNQVFAFFTEGDAAWLDDPAQGSAMASAIRAGSTMVFEGTNERGVKIRQTFSLSGSTAAMRAIDAECG